MALAPDDTRGRFCCVRPKSLETKTQQPTHAAYTYDDNGNRITKDNSTYIYDSFNRLIEVDGVTYTYDGNGLMQTRTVDGVTTRFIWDGTNIVAEVTGNEVVTYQRGLRLISRDDGMNKEYYHHNPHGDVTSLTNGYGAVTASYTYDAFGNVIDQTGSSSNHFKYCGEYQETNGLLYLRARWLDLETSTFLTEDSWRDGNNWYRYANANPIRYYDPSGHVVTKWDENHLTPGELKVLQHYTDNWSTASTATQKLWRDEANAIKNKYVIPSHQLVDDSGYVCSTSSGAKLDALIVDYKNSGILGKASSYIQAVGVGLGMSYDNARSNYQTAGSYMGADPSFSGAAFDVTMGYWGAGSLSGEIKILNGAGSSEGINWKNGDGYPKPPDWNSNWEWRYGTRENTSPRWFDPNGGEWR